MNLTVSEKADLARELDVANDHLFRAVSEAGDDSKALMIALGYGVAALCRFAAETVRPGGVQIEDRTQLKLFPDQT